MGMNYYTVTKLPGGGPSPRGKVPLVRKHQLATELLRSNFVERMTDIPRLANQHPQRRHTFAPIFGLSSPTRFMFVVRLLEITEF